MKLALVSDLHAYSKTLSFLEEIIRDEDPEGIVFSGDITQRSDTDFLQLIFDLLEKYGVEGYMICGNADEGLASKMIHESKYSINQKCRNGICGICDHEEALMNADQIAGNIFVTHRPPQKSALNVKLKNAPAIHISGHLHSLKMARQYSATFAIQVPTLQNGEYAILESETKKVGFNKVG